MARERDMRPQVVYTDAGTAADRVWLRLEIDRARRARVEAERVRNRARGEKPRVVAVIPDRWCGTDYGYKLGCRGEACKASHSATCAAYRARKRAAA